MIGYGFAAVFVMVLLILYYRSAREYRETMAVMARVKELRDAGIVKQMTRIEIVEMLTVMNLGAKEGSRAVLEIFERVIARRGFDA